MKRERNASCLIAAVLAFMLSFGGLGCMVTGLRLEVGSMWLLAAACAVFSLGSAVCFRLKWGGTVLLCLLALASGFLWHSNRAAEQLQVLLYRISYLYDLAYGWGVLLPDGNVPMNLAVDYPLGLIGCAVAVCTCWTVCRGKAAIFAVLPALLPLGACLVVTDTVPEEGYLFLLLLGLIVLVMTGGLRRSDRGQANTLTYIVLPLAAVALGILFLAVPQDGYVNRVREMQDRVLTWAEEVPQILEDLTQEAQTGLSADAAPEVDLRNLGPRKEYTYPVMDVVASGTGTLYLREQDYDLYDGYGWSADPQRQEVFGGSAGGGILEAAGKVSINTTRGREVTYVPYYPLDQVAISGGETANANQTEFYEFTRQALPEGWRALIVSVEEGMTVSDLPGGWSDGGSDSRYLALPDETRARAEELLDAILTDGRSATEKADAIAAYVRGSAVYDKNTGRMPTGETDFALWFLEDSDTGYCVHFATASTVLLRAAGVRARYVTGYMTQTVAGRPVTVTAAQAHAWAEYYEPQLGLWIVLESTPADPGTDASVATEPATEPGSGSTGPDTTTPSTEPAPPTLPTQPAEGPARPTEATTPTGGGETPEEPREMPRWLSAVGGALLILAVGIGAVMVQRELRLQWRRKGLRRGDANTRALAKWREAELLYRRLDKTPPQELEALAQKARFSQHTLTAEELKVFDTHLRLARQACREKPWYARLADRYIYTDF